MLLTPPDIISQTLLAVPMWILFELGVVFSAWFEQEREGDGDEEQSQPLSEKEMDEELDRIEAGEKDQ